MKRVSLGKTARLIRRLFGLVKTERRSYIAVCAFGVVIAGLEMVPPKLVGQAIDMMTARDFDFRTVAVMAGLWAGIAITVQFLHSQQIWLAGRAGEKILARLRSGVFDQLQRLSLGFFERTHPGRILTMSGSDIDSVRSVLTWGLNTVFANGALMLIASFMIWHTDPILFFSTVWLAPTMTLLNFHYGKRVTAAWQEVREHSSAVGANQAENIAGVKVVVAFNRQEQNLARFNHLQDVNTANNVMASRKSGLFQPMLQLVRFAGQAIILLVGAMRVSKGELGAGSLVAVILYWDWFMAPAVNFGVFFNDLLIALSGAERVFGLLDEEPDVQDSPDAVDLPQLKGEVRFEDVTFRYPASTKDVLSKADFAVPAGSMVALVGETGSGKSTIVSLIARFYQPSSGRVLIDGYDLKHIRGKTLQRQMAMVLQSNYLFNASVLENLRYARPEATDEDIFHAARTLGCHERFLQMKDGYDTKVGEKGANLSLGERQLVCFTRALVVNPALLLLDEATSSLDPITGHQVQTALARLARGRTTFIVTHRLSTVKEADVILVVDKGEVVEHGTHEELLRQDGRYAALFASSLAGVRGLEASPKLELVPV